MNTFLDQSLPKLDGTTRVTGRHMHALSERYNSYELQQILGLYAAKITQDISAKNIDNTIEDVARCLVIRTIFTHPEWAPLYKLKHYTDLIDRVTNAKKGFPLPTTKTHAAVIFGKSNSTAHSLDKGRKEVQMISIWISVLLEHFDELEKQGKDHFLYKILEEEALSRNFNGIQSIIYAKGWPKAAAPANETSKDIPARITGQEMHALLHSDDYPFNYIDLQHLLGSYMAKMSVTISKKNRNNPIDDVTRSLMIRLLLKYPELAPLPERKSYSDFVKSIDHVSDSFPLPTIFTKQGVMLGRSLSTVNGLKRARKEVPVLMIWITILLSQLDELDKQGKNHPLYKILEDEAKARGLNLQDVILHGGWPSSA